MRRKVMIISFIGVVAVILAAGALTAARLTAEQALPTNLPGNAKVFEDVMDDGSGNPVTVKTVILPSPALPERPSEAAGVLLRQEDNSYYVGTGSVSVSINIVNGEQSTAVDHSGPEIEVVAGRDTQFYRDVTEVNFTAAESKEQTLQQEVVAAEQPETISAGSDFQAWGERVGDRIVADVIVYSDPH